MELKQLSPDKLRQLGRIMLYIAAGLLAIAVILPWIILDNIKSHLQKEFQFSQRTAPLWESIPGNRSIIYQKRITFYDLLQKRYYNLQNFELNTSQSIIWDKQSFLKNQKYNEWLVTADYAQTYSLNRDYKPDEVYSKTITQVRPGVLRSIKAIEQRTEG